MAGQRKILAVLSESVAARTIKRRGVPTIIHERVFAYRLSCGHEVTRRYPMNAGTTKARSTIRACEVCQAEEKEAACA